MRKDLEYVQRFLSRPKKEQDLSQSLINVANKDNKLDRDFSCTPVERQNQKTNVPKLLICWASKT